MQQRRGDRPFELQPAVERLLDGPRSLAEAGEADHAAAALEGVEAAADGAQRVRVGRRCAQALELLVQGGEDLLRFLDEDAEELGVDRALFVRHGLGCGGGRCGRLCCGSAVEGGHRGCGQVEVELAHERLVRRSEREELGERVESGCSADRGERRECVRFRARQRVDRGCGDVAIG